MKRVIILILALFGSAPLLADCPPFALHGDWNVFYPDDAAPDSVLKAGSVLEIRYFKEHDTYTVKLDDPAWSARRNTWAAECLGDVAVLTGVLQERYGTDRVMVEVNRVKDERELVARSSGRRSLDQISIRVLDCIGLECDFARQSDPESQALPAADPGHAHADR
ncbi:hypothetical protein [Elongatibacter sediminis]|uniref:Lipoprotein n=1 Tax=Elongatibacter sediminis TaxID=3119006 RepID=A0AAW9R917_9GAMM